MRVALIVMLALAALVGLTPPADACSASHPGAGPITGPIGSAITTVTNAIVSVYTTVTGGSGPGGGEPGTAVASAGGGTGEAGSTTNNFITNNFITNGTSEGAASDGGATGAGGAGGGGGSTTASMPTMAGGGGGGGGGVGGGGIGGGGFSRSSGISGMPQNPSADLTMPTMAATGSPRGSGGGTTLLNDAGPAGQTAGVGFAAASDDSDGPLTAGVRLAALPAGGSSDDGVRIAAALTDPSASIATSGGFAFEGAARDGRPMTGRSYTTLLAGLIGVGVMGAAWAWRQIVV